MMHENKIAEGNLVIAEFMGGSIESSEKYEMPHGSRGEGTLTKWHGIEKVPGSYNDMARLGIFYYDSRIEWIWPVVDKIESLGYEFVISRRGIQVWKRPANGRASATDLIIDEDFLDDYVEEQKIKSIWDCCVSFIVWYINKNKKL
jgi:hypothetical protein